MPADHQSRRPASREMRAAARERTTRTLRAAKQELRTALRLRRRVRGEDERRTADERRLSALLDLLEPALAAGRLGTVACYLSRPDEPGTLQLVAWLAAHEVPVLLPVASGSAPDWARYTGPDALRTGPHDILEPTGPRVGADALAEADVIVCPGLAATAQGARLGQGAGWYDRALERARPDAVLVLLLDDDEVLGSVPVEPHDRPVDVIVTATRTIHTSATTG